MRKLAVCLLLIGIIIASAAIGVGIMVRDHEEVQTISAVTGIPITPEHGAELRQAALDRRLKMSGTVDYLLQIYPFIPQVTTLSAGIAAFGLLLLLLVLIIRPVMSVIVLIAIAALIYFGSQGYLGEEAGSFVNMIIQNLKGFFDRIVSFVHETKLVDTITQLVTK